MLAPVIMTVLRSPAAGLPFLVGGILTLGSAALVHALTLPMESNASFARALPILERERHLIVGDMPHARRFADCRGAGLMLQCLDDTPERGALVWRFCADDGSIYIGSSINAGCSDRGEEGSPLFDAGRTGVRSRTDRNSPLLGILAIASTMVLGDVR